MNLIKYANSFLIKAKNIVQNFYEMFDEKNVEKKSQKFLSLVEKLDELKFNEIKSNLSSHFGNNNGNNNDGLPNCKNLITICSLFYEEIFNESISNAGTYIRETSNILEELVNNNNKNSKQITLQINIKNFNIIIVRAGGYLNNNFIDIFPTIVKNNQIIEIKNLLLNSNNNLQKGTKKYNKKNALSKKGKEDKRQYIYFTFIIEEKEENNIFYRLLNLELSLLFIPNISHEIYLNGSYILDNDIIITGQQEDKEFVLYYGNKEQMDFIKNNNINKIIKKNKYSKYLGNNKLIKDSINIIDEKYAVYHFQITSEKKKNIIEDKNKTSNIKDIEDETINLFDENNDLFFNDIASQGSSKENSVARNSNLNYYNRGNKKVKNNENFSKQLYTFKYILLLSISLFSAFIIFQCLYLYTYQTKIYKSNNFYLILKDYSSNFDILFFSILTLTCLADSDEDYHCIHLVNAITEYTKILANNTNDSDNNFEYINITKLLFVQNEILTENLNNKLSNIKKYLSTFKEDEFKSYQKIVTHFRINQLTQNNNNIVLSATKEDISFSDFILLITSRFGIIIKNYNDIFNPIYILNKTGEETFNNVFLEGRLNSYQVNIYLLILDFEIFNNNLDEFINEVRINSYQKDKIKNIIIIFDNINLFLIIIIILFLFIYICIYLIIIFKIMSDVYMNLKEKIGDIKIKDFIRKKVDNLHLLLNFYENDINSTIQNLNNTYNDYLENYNLKIKEETRLLKKEGKNQIDNNKNNFNASKFYKLIRKYGLFSYSKRKKIYLFNFFIILFFSLSSYIISLSQWLLFFKKEDKIQNWTLAADHLLSASKKYMNNFLLMFFHNQTLEDCSKDIESNDYIFYVFSTLTSFYEADKYFNSLLDIMPFSEQNLVYDCKYFYETLNNENFEKLKIQFINEKQQLLITMQMYCESTKVTMFKNFKALYLQLLTNVKLIMENNYNKEYTDIINNYLWSNTVSIEISYLLTYFYFQDLLYTNFKEAIFGLVNKIGNNITINNIIFFLLLVLLISIIPIIYLRNINNDYKKFIEVKNVFRVCN